MATHSSILAWRSPGTEEPGGATVRGVTKSQARQKRLTQTQTEALHDRMGLVLGRCHLLNEWRAGSSLGQTSST